jgi:hypothetical protein
VAIRKKGHPEGNPSSRPLFVGGKTTARVLFPRQKYRLRGVKCLDYPQLLPQRPAVDAEYRRGAELSAFFYFVKNNTEPPIFQPNF